MDLGIVVLGPVTGLLPFWERLGELNVGAIGIALAAVALLGHG